PLGSSYLVDLRDLHSVPTRRSSDLFDDVVDTVVRCWWRRWARCRRPTPSGGRGRSAERAVDTTAPRIPGRAPGRVRGWLRWAVVDRKSTRLNSSHVKISYAVFCLKK